MLSICIACYNRSKVPTQYGNLLLLPKCLESIRDNIEYDYEVIIADFGSNDHPLDQWVRNVIPKTNIIQVQHDKFCKGLGLNLAVNEAVYNNMLLLDTDMLVCPRLFKEGIQHLHHNKPFFPICYTYTNPEHTQGFWHVSGFGNAFVTKKMYESCGGTPLYTSWGREDTDLFKSINKMYKCHRFTVNGFYHQWHPDDYEWKNKYYNSLS